ncbi:MAG TPA: GvpL/GvpF family gas vesicle protein [Pseudonocardiaceae bacterium]|nr:GvpL/GvpF family gas vesicle protein [Pseudonocardiaceae bacterium]
MALHVYAVVTDEQDLPDRTGMRDEPLEPVRSGGLAAVVSRTEPDTEATEADVIAHLDVITDLVAAGPVIPMRFGTVAPDADAVRQEVLDDSRSEFEEYLRATRDVVETMVSIHFDENAALREIMRQDRERDSWHADSMADKIALGQTVAESLSARVHEWGDELIQSTAGIAQAVQALDTPDHTAVRYALLVGRDRLADLDERMRGIRPAAAGGAVPYDVEYVGPLPPVDFPLQPTSDDHGTSRWGW